MLLPSIIASAMIAINWGDFSILYINNPVWDIRWATRRQIRVHASLTRIENISFEKTKLKYEKKIFFYLFVLEEIDFVKILDYTKVLLRYF